MIENKINSNGACILLAFICWIIGTFVLLFSLIGMVLLLADENGKKSTWMYIGQRLVDKLVS